MTLTETARGYEVTFEFHPRKVAAVKRIEGSYWIPEKKAWVVPRGKKSEIDRVMAKFGDESAFTGIREMNGEIPELPELKISIPLKKQLYPYQQRSVAYNLEKKNVLNGLEPGLGKSFVSIATLVAANAFPCLVTCPVTLKENWKREWEMFSDKRVMILSDRYKNSWKVFWETGMIDVFICNYESLTKYFVESIDIPTGKTLRLNHITFKNSVSVFKSIIVDESHKIRNGSSRVSKLIMGVSKGKEYKLLLSGTPLVNRPLDLVPQLHVLGLLKAITDHLPPLTDKTGKTLPYKMFTERYCQGKQKASNLKELNYRLNMVGYYRMEKKDVLKDLPLLTRQIMLCEIDTREEYQKAENDFEKYLREVKACTDEEIATKMRGEIMVRMMVLKNISARGKIDAVVEFVSEIVEAGEKVLVFGYLKEVIEGLKKHFPGAGTIDGSTKIDQRQRYIDDFQNNKSMQVLLLNYKSGGVGLNLTASSRVVFIEFPWTHADCDQCESRSLRNGQKFPVTSTYFLGQDTVDEFCMKIIERKKRLMGDVTGSTDTVEPEIIDDLLNLFNNKKK